MKYLGLDWASEIHLVALVDQQGGLLEEWEIEHTRAATIGLLSRLEREGGPGGVKIAIESGAPLLVDLLVEAGYAVFEINPKQADRFRDRHSPAGCKDDRRDAYVLADALRTDAIWLTPVVPDRPETQELRQRSGPGSAWSSTGSGSACSCARLCVGTTPPCSSSGARCTTSSY